MEIAGCDIGILIGAVLLLGALVWFFLGSRGIDAFHPG